MALDVMEEKGHCQSSKADVWSLFVTTAYVMNVNGYRTIDLQYGKDAVNHVLRAAQTSELSRIKAVVHLGPGDRASTLDLLLDLFNGQ